MNGPKIHKHENGFETFVCSKCKKDVERVQGIRTEKSKNSFKPRFKWMCELCFAGNLAMAR